jgi:arylamine N-acetyltransferase
MAARIPPNLCGQIDVSTPGNPSSHFVTSLMASVVTADGRYNLSGRNLAFHHDGTTEKIRLDDAAAVVDTLADRFGINMADAGERSVLEARIDEVDASGGRRHIT